MATLGKKEFTIKSLPSLTLTMRYAPSFKLRLWASLALMRAVQLIAPFNVEFESEERLVRKYHDGDGAITVSPPTNTTRPNPFLSGGYQPIDDGRGPALPPKEE